MIYLTSNSKLPILWSEFQLWLDTVSFLSYCSAKIMWFIIHSTDIYCKPTALCPMLFEVHGQRKKQSKIANSVFLAWSLHSS